MKKENINQFQNQKPLKVPENYFDAFALNMTEQLVKKEELNWFQKIFSAPVLKLAVPSLLVVLLCCSIYLINTARKANTTAVSNEDITRFLLENDEFSIESDFEQMLAANLNLNQISLTEEEIIEYLLEEEIEIELLNL